MFARSSGFFKGSSKLQTTANSTPPPPRALLRKLEGALIALELVVGTDPE